MSGFDETTTQPIASMIDEIETFDGFWCDRMRELHRKCAWAFGKQHGWTRTKRYIHPLRLVGQKPANPYELPEPFDHVECFVLNRRPVAVVSHTYVPPERAERMVREMGLPMRWLERSWYNPHDATAFVVTKPQ